MKKAEKPNGKDTLLGTYAVDQDARVVYELGVDERGGTNK